MKPQVVADHDLLVCVLGALKQLGDAREVVADRLFDEHVRACAHRLAGGLDVQAGRVGNHDHVGPFFRERPIQVAVFACVDAERLGQRRTQLATHRERPELQRSPVARVAATDRAETDDQPLHRVGPAWAAMRRAYSNSASARSSGVSMSIESSSAVTRPATRWPIITPWPRMTSRRVTSTTPFCQ